MSNKANKTQGAQPKLRFPEFRDADGWEIKELDEVARFVNDRISSEHLSISNYVSTENILPDFAGIATASKLPSIGSATKYQPNDILVSNIRPYLKKVWVSDKNGGASNDVIVIRNNHIITDNFLSFLLKNDSFIDYVMQGAKGVKMPRGDINLMKEYPITYPLDNNEQQKIADCLSSLDELVEAQTQKLEALQQHKKGLMQELFPAEGETLPKLRFPEFLDAGDWEKKSISDKSFANIYKGKGIPKSDIIHDGKIPCIRYGELYTHYGEVIEEVISKTNCPEAELFFSKNNDLIIPSSGETKADISTASCVKLDNIALGSDINVIRTTQNGSFLSYYFNGALKNKISKLAQGYSVVHLYPSQLEKISLMIPKTKEQKKIADCLSSLNELIKAESTKLKALQQHKKGLMQQLFPTLSNKSKG